LRREEVGKFLFGKVGRCPAGLFRLLKRKAAEGFLILSPLSFGKITESGLVKLFLALALFVPLLGHTQPLDPLVPLARPGPWSGVSELIGYAGRIWFVNSVKFVDHNSADVYSYDPSLGQTRYERHLFSQDAGEPAIANGLLYWPFEDARFSTGRGEYMVTNGRDWQWRILPDGEVFHVHAMIAHRGNLFAATGAWRAGLQRSKDGGITWEVIYDHPTPPRSVSRITTLAILGDTLYAGLTDYRAEGSKLLRLVSRTIRPVVNWPPGTMVTSLAAYRGFLYGVNTTGAGSAVWRTDGTTAQRVRALDGYHIRAFAAGSDDFWAVSADAGNGILWRSGDGVQWSRMQRFRDAEPVDVLVYAGKVYVGAIGPNGRGTLWGPPAPAPIETHKTALRLPPTASPLTPQQLRETLVKLDRVLKDKSTYIEQENRLFATLISLGLSGTSEAGTALVRRLEQSFPDVKASLFGGQLNVSAAQMARWYLLWAIALNGRGRILVTFFSEPWTERPNRSEKYLHPGPAAAWTVAQLGQADDETIGALIMGLERVDYPLWFNGDLVGALTAVTGERFGYDFNRWRSWWNKRAAGRRGAMIDIPSGALLMGSNDGEPAEQPVHQVDVSAFSIDRLETTNSEFAAFVSATGYRTDPERSGVGWDWDEKWREVKGADWRHPRGPASSIKGLEEHPVVQVSWNDARAYCRWREKRLPTEAEWERAARADGDRTYPWGNESPRDGTHYRASYGTDECCRADAGDGYLFTAPVASFPLGRSPFGIEDMAGNVWEWVEDWFDPKFYQKSPSANPVNRTLGGRKIIRGGGWGNNPYGLRSTLRHANPREIGLSMVGFRCAQ
jgi:formylglycine-generating enzyme required for sulfatase activity